MDTTDPKITRSLNIQTAKIAEQTERYEDMRNAMKRVVDSGGPLNVEERNLLSVAYKNVCGARRSAWRILNSISGNSESDPVRKEAIETLKLTIQVELNAICDDILLLISKNCLQKDESKDANDQAAFENVTFFQKMKGDYYRYLVEVATDDKKEKLIHSAEEAYSEAMKEATKMANTNPVRLGLALNYSVFFYEIKNDKSKACEMAKQAFDDAISELDSLKEESYKDSTLIMQLLRDNLTLWQSEDDAGDDE